MKIKTALLGFVYALALLACSDVQSPVTTLDSWSADLSTVQDSSQPDTTIVAPDLGAAPDTNSSPDPGTTPDEGPNPDTSPTPTEAGIRFVRVHTSNSPSWVAWSEIQVWGAPEGPHQA